MYLYYLHNRGEPRKLSNIKMHSAHVTAYDPLFFFQRCDRWDMGKWSCISVAETDSFIPYFLCLESLPTSLQRPFDFRNTSDPDAIIASSATLLSRSMNHSRLCRPVSPPRAPPDPGVPLPPPPPPPPAHSPKLLSSKTDPEHRDDGGREEGSEGVQFLPVSDDVKDRHDDYHVLTPPPTPTPCRSVHPFPPPKSE